MVFSGVVNNRCQILSLKVSTGRISKLICLLFAGINVAAVVVPLAFLVLLAVLLAAGFFYYKRQVDHFDTEIRVSQNLVTLRKSANSRNKRKKLNQRKKEEYNNGT